MQESANLSERVFEIMKAVRAIEEAYRAGKAVGVNGNVGAGVHDLPREAFDALPSVGGVVEWRDGERRYWSKSITKDSTAYTNECPAEKPRELIVKRQEAKYDRLEPGQEG